MSEYLIETTNLTKRFGSFIAVNGISLKVKQGEIYGFLGPNGAGKTTTIRMLLGLIAPTTGDAKIFGKSMKSDSLEILRKVGSLVEYPSYYGNLTGRENLEITRRILDLNRSEIDRALQVVRLTDWADRSVKKYSLGMKQRLGIAHTLMGNRELLILDEPTNGLDPAGIQEMRELIKTLPGEYGMTVLVSSHILSEIELMASSIGIIHKGRLHYQGPLSDLHHRTAGEIYLEVSPQEKAFQYLSAKGYEPVPKRQGFAIPSQAVRAAVVNRELVMNSFDVHHLSESRQSLEDVFLSITREEGAR